MFTGLIEAIGAVVELQPQGGDIRLWLQVDAWTQRAFVLGDSIAVNGVCLTLIEREQARFAFDVSDETLRCSSLAQLKSGARVNLETALTLQKPLGGHWVSGHVDGVGQVMSVTPVARGQEWQIQFPPALAKFIAAKGSITIDGISLTVNRIDDDTRSFEVMIVPHTQTHTNIGDWQIGQAVNLEVDLLARYLQRLMTAPTHENE
jgi:riboflavin synthase